MLLATKFFIPQPHSHLVTRTRLLTLLEQGRRGKIILISAPAGAGKTSLVADWLLHQAASPVVWLSLDEHDNDPARFLAYLTAGCQKVDPMIGLGVQALLQTPQPPPLNTLLPPLLHDLNQVAKPWLLILDDYHLITTPSIHQALTFLIDHLPSTLVLVLLTRNDPPLPLSRWRVRRELTEVRQRDLRFTEAETATFLQQELAVELPASAITALSVRTEGWIAGLQLAALSMHERTNLNDFVQSFTGSHAYIVDYLTEEVLNRQSPPVRRFLLQTSLLTRLCASLCDAVMGGDAEDMAGQESSLPEGGSQAVLAQLERANLFVVPLDQERRWYRYHHLFADVLQRWLRQEQAALTPLYHRRAGRWYEQQGLLLDALHHALAANEFVYASTLLEASVEPLRKRGEFATLAALLNRLPDHLVRVQPRLCLERASALMFQHQLDEAEQWLVAAEQAAMHANSLQALRGHLAAIRTDMALNRSELATAITLAETALAHLPATDLHMRSFVNLLSGVAHMWSHQYVQAEAAFQQAIDQATQSGTLVMGIYALVAKSEVLYRLGQLPQVQVTLQQALTYADAHGVAQTPMLAGTHANLGEVYYEWNELDRAAAYLQQSITLAQQARNPRTQLHGYTGLLRVAAAQQNRALIQQITSQAEELIRQFSLPPPMVNDFRIVQWRLTLKEGQCAQVAAQVRQWQQGGQAVPTDMENFELLRVRLLLAQSAYPAALELLQTVTQHVEAIQHLPHRLEALALTALAHAGVGQHTQARQFTQDLLRQAQPAGFVRTLLDAGPALRPLIDDCRLYMTAGLLDNPGPAEAIRSYMTHVLAAFSHEFPSNPALTTTVLPTATQHAARSTVVEPLSEREVEVLRLVADGLSNQQIADRLIITVGTVKRHLNNIFGKLGVSSRTQALNQARALAFLP